MIKHSPMVGNLCYQSFSHCRKFMQSDILPLQEVYAIRHSPIAGSLCNQTFSHCRRLSGRNNLVWMIFVPRTGLEPVQPFLAKGF